MNVAVNQNCEAGKSCCCGSGSALFASSIVCGIALARGAVWIEEAGFAPLIVFRVLLGGLLGMAAWVLAGQLGLKNPRLAVAAALCSTFAFVVFEHMFFYLDYRSSLAAAVERNPAAALFQSTGEVKPASFLDFLNAGAARTAGPLSGWARWIIDAVLTIVAAASVAWFTSRPRASLALRDEIPS